LAQSCARGGAWRSCGSNIVRMSIRRWLFLAVALALPATVLHAARPIAPDAVGRTSLAGQLLIASPELRQPEFDHAVILLAKHTREGALGIVINRPGKMHPIADLLIAFGADTAGVHGDIQIFLGGPVDPGIGFVADPGNGPRKAHGLAAFRAERRRSCSFYAHAACMRAVCRSRFELDQPPRVRISGARSKFPHSGRATPSPRVWGEGRDEGRRRLLSITARAPNKSLKQVPAPPR
jgi:Uncharacterized ACR, COG1678